MDDDQAISSASVAAFYLVVMAVFVAHYLGHVSVPDRVWRR